MTLKRNGYLKRKTELKPGPGYKGLRRTGIKSKNRHRAADAATNAARDKEQRECWFLRLGGTPEAGSCFGRITTHHAVSRSVIEYRHKAWNLVDLCAYHHMSGRWCAEQDGYWWKIGTTHTAVIEEFRAAGGFPAGVAPGMVKQRMAIPKKTSTQKARRNSER